MPDYSFIGSTDKKAESTTYKGKEKE